MDNNTELPSDIAVQKLIALSLIGYLQALKHDGQAELDINYIFKPMPTVRRMEQLGFEKTIIDAVHQLDEVETLVGAEVFMEAVDDLLLPLIAFVRRARVPNDGFPSAVSLLLA